MTIFIKNPSSGSRVAPCGRTDTKNQIMAFRNFAKAPKNDSRAAICMGNGGLSVLVDPTDIGNKVCCVIKKQYQLQRIVFTERLRVSIWVER